MNAPLEPHVPDRSRLTPTAQSPPSAGDGAPLSTVPAPPVDETVAMSAAAGARPTLAVAALEPPKKKKGKKSPKGRLTPMASAAPASGATPDADEMFREMGTKRGIETLFRTSYQTNMDLTALADAKANIMISINGLIVSILIASIAPGMENNTWLLLPTSLFLLGCLVSLVFAVLSARPRVQSQVVTKESALRDRTNVLFFGNFSHMPPLDYVDVMKEVVRDPTQIYEMMMKDVYGIGSVLQKKYRLLRASYLAFLVALVIGVVAFIGVFAYAVSRDTSPDHVYTTPLEAAPPGAVAPETIAPGGLLP